MKALTIIQPWATLIAIGAKKIETRSWPTKYRGPLAIHAGNNTQFCRMGGKHYLCGAEPFCSILNAHGKALPRERGPLGATQVMPLGAVVATCTLEECWKITHGLPNLSQQERAFGDFGVGRWMWMLENITPIGPIPVKGAMGLWEWGGAA